MCKTAARRALDELVDLPSHPIRVLGQLNALMSPSAALAAVYSSRSRSMSLSKLIEQIGRTWISRSRKGREHRKMPKSGRCYRG